MLPSTLSAARGRPPPAATTLAAGEKRGLEVDASSRRSKREARQRHFWLKFSALSTAVIGAATLGATILKPDSAAPQNSVGGDVAGTCVAVGEGSQACVTLEPQKYEQYAGATFGPLPDAKAYRYPGKLSSLPAPPDYTANDYWNHCEQWTDWIKQNKLHGPGALIVTAQTGEGETLSVVGVSVKLLRVEQPKEVTEIACGHGGGSLVPGSFIRVDTRTGNVKAAQGSDTNLSEKHVYAPMPPASISLTGADSETVQISMKGDPKKFYEGIVTVTLMVNGQERVVVWGSTESPFRWVPAGALSPGPDSWAWNPRTHEWAKDFDQSDLQ